MEIILIFKVQEFWVKLNVLQSDHFCELDFHIPPLQNPKVTTFIFASSFKAFQCGIGSTTDDCANY